MDETYLKAQEKLEAVKRILSLPPMDDPWWDSIIAGGTVSLDYKKLKALKDTGV